VEIKSRVEKGDDIPIQDNWCLQGHLVGGPTKGHNAKRKCWDEGERTGMEFG
jgi:hypothetical protein